MQGGNLVYCAPTSGGKSLVAEVCMLRAAASTRKPTLLVLPFRALCEEKVLCPGSHSSRMCIVTVVTSRKTGCVFFPLCLEKCSSSLLNSLLQGSVLVGCALWQGRLV